jgi:glutamate-1-semialdehyde 2,1-aminomutase
VRNEGARLGSGEKLWKRAKRVIPGGSMLLSKRGAMYLPNHWPSYFTKAKGCRVWDLDGHEYVDMSTMGMGTNILGYGHPEVDAAVVGAVDAGNMSRFNCPEEVYLAERLIEIHPWAQMVLLAPCMTEARALALRVARAACGRDNVAICMHQDLEDWQPTANIAAARARPSRPRSGLELGAASQNSSERVYPFRYNDFSQLKDLVREHDIGVIMVDITHNNGAEADFLRNMRELAIERGIVLIFDECMSGFRQTFGGLHMLVGAHPDMAIFGEALGNGYAITAVIGKREVMQAAQGKFISGTCLTERIGPTAALKTLEVMERDRSWEAISDTGRQIAERWQALARKYELPLHLSGLPALIAFSFSLSDMPKYKTLLAQEMLKEGLLATTSVYASTAHTQAIVDQYFAALDPLFAMIKECESGRPIDALLEDPVCNA